MKDRVGVCDEETFWEAVEEIGWGTPTKEFFEQIKSQIFSAWSEEFFHSFTKLLYEKKNALARRIEVFEEANDTSCGVGDDGFSDLTSHIVGLGRREYEATMKDPWCAIHRASNWEFQESFLYCFSDLTFPRSDLTFEEAEQEIRQEMARVYGEGLGFPADEQEGKDTELLDLKVKQEALERVQGYAVYRNPKYYALWAQQELIRLDRMPTTFRERLTNLQTVMESLQAIAKEDLSPLGPQLQKSVEALREERKELYDALMQEAQAVRPDWGINNLVSDALEKFG